MSRLRAQRSTRHAFSLPFPADAAYKMLRAAYIVEVTRCNRKFIDDEATQKNIQALADVLTDKTNNYLGVMICGRCGNGKTTLLLALQNLLSYLVHSKDLRGMYKSEYDGVVIIDARELARTVAATGKRTIDTTTGIVAIEDIGREAGEVQIYGNVYYPVAEVLEERYAEQKFTIVTTNLTPTQIREKYGERVADRCNEMFAVVVFENETYR